MHLDLDALFELAKSLGFACQLDDRVLRVSVTNERILEFENFEDVNGDTGLPEANNMITFAESTWHSHDDISFVDKHGHFRDFEFGPLLVALSKGEVLINEHFIEDELVDVCLMHKKLNDEFQYVDEGESIRVIRAQRTLSPRAQQRSRAKMMREK